jgi:small-conductance mechanosensitive channel
MKLFDMDPEEMNDFIQPYFQGAIDGTLSLLKGLAVLFLGWLIAKFIKRMVVKLLSKIQLDNKAEKLGLDIMFDRVGISSGISKFIGATLYWLIMLFVIMGASRTSGLFMLADKIESFFNFVPALFSALVIFLFGMLLAQKIKEIINNVSQSLGAAAGKILSNLIYYFILVMLTITSLDQLGIDTTLISNNLIMIIGLSLLAGTLAYGLAAKDVMSNILASFFGKKNFVEGQIIEVDGVRGQIIKMDNVSVTILNNEREKVVIPARFLLENKVLIIKDVEPQDDVETPNE